MELTERDYACFGPRDTKPTGSIPWCWQTLDLLKIRWQRKDFTQKQFAETLAELEQQRVWEVIPPERPYGTRDAMLQAEIGCTEEEARRRWDAEATGSTGGRPATKERGKFPLSTQEDRAAKNGITTRTQKKLDYLAGHAPALLAAVQAGDLSTHAAYCQARGLPKETPLTTLHRVWRQVDPDDRRRFLVEMLTPNERRALMLGLEDSENG